MHQDKIEEKSVFNNENHYDRIPFTKVYYLDTVPENKECIISQLPLDFYKDQILAYPFCDNMAKKESLVQWLEDKEICPICKQKLNHSECLVVDIKNK